MRCPTCNAVIGNRHMHCRAHPECGDARTVRDDWVRRDATTEYVLPTYDRVYANGTTAQSRHRAAVIGRLSHTAAAAARERARRDADD